MHQAASTHPGIYLVNPVPSAVALFDDPALLADAAREAALDDFDVVDARYCERSEKTAPALIARLRAQMKDAAGRIDEAEERFVSCRPRTVPGAVRKLQWSLDIAEGSEGYSVDLGASLAAGLKLVAAPREALPHLERAESLCSQNFGAVDQITRAIRTVVQALREGPLSP